MANGGDAASEIWKLCAEYHSFIKEKEKEASDKHNWFIESEITYFLLLTIFLIDIYLFSYKMLLNKL